MPELPTGTVTFLYTDIEGSTNLLQQLGPRYSDALSHHHQLLRQAISEWHGCEVNTQGDSFFVAFARASDALSAAAAAQRALLAHAWSDTVKIYVRMGLHTGEPTLAGDDYVGLDAHRAARIGAAGHGGQILISEATRILVEYDLPKEIQLRDLGEHRLKDLQHSEHIYQVDIDGLPTEFPTLKTLGTQSHNLPIQLTSFIGRKQELKEIVRLLESPNPRLLTLVGPGGTGKTRLSLQAAAEVLPDFQDGVWLVELAPITDDQLLPQAIAITLRVREEPGRSLQNTLINFLRTKHLLLILDNCEHLVEASARLADILLHTCPKLRILASSREAFGIAGEMTWPVPPLSLPDLHHMPSPEMLTHYEAVKLFIERAVAVQPGFQMTNQNAPAVAQLCLRLDGIPLAIELAVVRLKVLNVEHILSRIEKRLQLLTGGSRTALPRQQTLRALIDWSYNLLSEAERTLFTRLSVFARGWDSEAMETICIDDHIVMDIDVLDLLIQLVDKSLVVKVEDEQGGLRYRLFETLREYAHEHLVERGELETIQEKHFTYFFSLAEQASASDLEQQATWFQHLDVEHDNLWAALGYIRTHTHGEDDERYLQIAGALSEFWLTRLHIREGQEHLTAALALPSSRSINRARALIRAGNFALIQRDLQTGKSLIEQGLEIWQELGDSAAVMRGLQSLIAAERLQGDYASARQRAEELLALHMQKAVKDEEQICLTLLNIGQASCGQHDFTAARAAYEQAHTIAATLNITYLQIFTNHGLADTALWNEEYSVAISYYKRALRLARELKEMANIMSSLEGLAMTLSVQGKAQSALYLAGAVMSQRTNLGFTVIPDWWEEGRKQRLDLAWSTLGEDEAKSAWETGSRMTLEEAITFLQGQIGLNDD
ncbi:adenylate/guanylate cyclase domain-containing protein [Dictyobacter formicarum]|uniref:Guanylate cyclase domain-containing protein n=1 Tax=Dictyobacter formicarum TaxID=2778368 RepID=A0ABQ3VRG4_9CHLR|nr:adenylate/guanylate cyclase domain-containing protein [Dictyobacter formicarum]GHO88859.1 hypothetical protein KSZ_68650 [Dictyobacter formicarum]